MESGNRGKPRRKASDAKSHHSFESKKSLVSKSADSLEGSKLKSIKSIETPLPSSTASRDQIRNEIATILLSSNLEFLEWILSNGLGKEGGSSLVKSILDMLLSHHSQDELEDFIIRVVKRKFEQHKKTCSEATMKTFLRDNSWEILLLSAYLHNESKKYLLQVLHGPVEGALPLFEKYDLSPTNPLFHGQRSPVQMLVEKILHSIIAKHESIPTALIRCCGFLKTEFDQYYNVQPQLQGPLPPSPLSPHSPSLDTSNSFIASPTSSPLSPESTTPVATKPMPNPIQPSLAYEFSEYLPASIDEFVSTAESPEQKQSPSRRSLRKGHLASVACKFTIPEHMLSTFLFLRLFVPVLTLPEKHGLLTSEQATKAASKYLLLAGKELITLCNDSETEPSFYENHASNRRKVKRILGLFTTEKHTAFDRFNPELKVELEEESLLSDKVINQYTLEAPAESTPSTFVDSELKASRFRQTVHKFDMQLKKIHKSLPVLNAAYSNPHFSSIQSQSTTTSSSSSPDSSHLNSNHFKKMNTSEIVNEPSPMKVEHPDNAFLSILIKCQPKLEEAMLRGHNLNFVQLQEYRSLHSDLKLLLEAFLSLSEQDEHDKNPSLFKKVGKWMRFASFSSSAKDLRKAFKNQMHNNHSEPHV